MKTQIYTLMVLLFLANSILAQEKVLPKTNQVHKLIKIDSTYAMLNNYLIRNNYAAKDNDLIYLFNLLSWKEYDLTDSCGIYVFGLKESEPTYFLFFVNKDRSYSIIEKNSLDLILHSAVDYFKMNNIIDKKQQLLYSYSLIKYFNTQNEYLIEDNILPHGWTK
jgi:hypothetical protein